MLQCNFKTQILNKIHWKTCEGLTNKFEMILEFFNIFL
jgi:hypothetical protein